ncbi:MAG: putative quinol monooxygenase [Oscillospiraceae bacterium]
MIRIVANQYFKPEDVEKVMPYFDALVAGSRAEEGNLAYELYVHGREPGHLVLIEQWEDKAFLARHSEQPHFVDNIAKIREYAAQASDMMILKPLNVK